MKFIKAAVTIPLYHSTELDAFHFWGVFCYFLYRTQMNKTFHTLTYLYTERFPNTFRNIHRCLWYRRSNGQGLTLELRDVNTWTRENILKMILKNTYTFISQETCATVCYVILYSFHVGKYQGRIYVPGNIKQQFHHAHFLRRRERAQQVQYVLGLNLI